MTNDTLLSHDSLQKIRRYVNVKYAHLPKEKHAEIVADAIVKVVENHLPTFEKETKKKVTQTVIGQLVSQKEATITVNDIMKIVDSQSLKDKDLLHYEIWKTEQKTLGFIIADAIQKPEQEHSVTLAERNQINQTSEIAATLVLPHIDTDNRSFNKSRATSIYTISFICLFVFIVGFSRLELFSGEKTIEVDNPLVITTETEVVFPIPLDLPANELPKHYQYIEFDREIIKAYLDSKNSLLVDEPYFSAIYNTALAFNIHPVLLFSITGQEQSFVPRNHESAEQIVQNPFNVFYSWQDYNTNIEDTTAIAARTLVNLSKDKPNDIEAIQWINRKYAEDPNWHKGVIWFFNTIISFQLSE